MDLLPAVRARHLVRPALRRKNNRSALPRKAGIAQSRDCRYAKHLQGPSPIHHRHPFPSPTRRRSASVPMQAVPSLWRDCCAPHERIPTPYPDPAAVLSPFPPLVWPGRYWFQRLPKVSARPDRRPLALRKPIGAVFNKLRRDIPWYIRPSSGQVTLFPCECSSCIDRECQPDAHEENMWQHLPASQRFTLLDEAAATVLSRAIRGENLSAICWAISDWSCKELSAAQVSSVTAMCV